MKVFRLGIGIVVLVLVLPIALVGLVTVELYQTIRYEIVTARAWLAGEL